jgi:F-type H+-transporting ATPase subunit b
MVHVATGPLPLASNFLVPNGTFIVELIAFAIIVWVLAKFVIPPINRAMTTRQDAIRKQFAELDEAKDDAHKAEEEYKSQLADARQAANKIREEAREQGNQIVAEAKEKAQTEADRIIENGHGQVRAERQQAVASLRAEVGTLATQLAGRIVGESLEDDERSTRVVDRFLTDLEAMQTAQAKGQQTAGAAQDGTS